MFFQPSFLDLLNATSSAASAAGPTPLSSPTGRKRKKSGQAPAPASHSAAPASAEAKPTSDTSGLNFAGSYPSAVLQLSLESKLKARMAGAGSLEYELTWKNWDMPLGLPICALRASGRQTSGSDCSGWPSPEAGNFGTTDLQRLEDRRAHYAEKYGNNGFGLTLGQAAILLVGWPTVSAADTKGRTYQYDNHDKNKPRLSLEGLLRGWPTPESLTPNAARGAGQCPLKRRAQGHQVNLQDAVIGTTAESSPAETAKCGVLDAAFSRWLQGYPSHWDEMSPNYDAWQSVQERIARDACAATATA